MALSVSQLASLTHTLILPKIVDNVFNSNPLLFRFRQKGIKYGGGEKFRQPLIYATTTSVAAYEGLDILPTALNDNITAAEFNWRQYAVSFGISGRDELMNSGKEGIHNLLDAKRQVAEWTLSNTLGTDLQASNSGGKSIDGFGSMLSATSTYGGIAVADMATWAAYVHTPSVAGTLTLLEMQKCIGSVTIGADRPTAIVTRQTVFNKFWSLVQPDQRFTDKGMADAGFENLKFNGIPVMVDSHVAGSDGGTQDNDMLFLNEKYLWLAAHRDCEFKVVPIPVQKDQDVKMVRIMWAGNLLCSNRRMQGIFSTVDPNL